MYCARRNFITLQPQECVHYAQFILVSKTNLASTIGQNPISWWYPHSSLVFWQQPISSWFPSLSTTPRASGASLAASSTSLSNSASTSRRSGGLTGVGKSIGFRQANPWNLMNPKIWEFNYQTVWLNYLTSQKPWFYQQESGFLPANSGSLSANSESLPVIKTMLSFRSKIDCQKHMVGDKRSWVLTHMRHPTAITDQVHMKINVNKQEFLKGWWYSNDCMTYIYVCMCIYIISHTITKYIRTILGCF